MSDQHLRIGDAERERAASALGEHFAQGRLTNDEHGERLDQIWSARTRGELVPIFADLPGRDGSPVTEPIARRDTRSPDRSGAGRGYWRGGLRPWRRGLPTPVFVILAILLVVTAITHLPLILFGLLMWFFVVSRHRKRPDARRW